MKTSIHTLLLIVAFIFCSFMDNKKENKKIINQLYSISVPSDWKCAHPKEMTEEDCSKPIERDAYIYHLYAMSWRSPSKSEDDFFNSIFLNIETYRRLDGNPATIKEIEDTCMDGLKETEKKGILKLIAREEIFSEKKQKQFLIREESQSISARKGVSTDKNVRIYLLYENKNMTHCIMLFVKESIYQFPETKKIINDILNSFTPRSA